MYVHVFSFLYFYSRSIKHVCGCVFILYFYSCSIDPFIDHHLAAAALAVLSFSSAGQRSVSGSSAVFAAAVSAEAAAAVAAAAAAAAVMCWLRQRNCSTQWRHWQRSCNRCGSGSFSVCGSGSRSCSGSGIGSISGVVAASAAERWQRQRQWQPQQRFAGCGSRSCSRSGSSGSGRTLQRAAGQRQRQRRQWHTTIKRAEAERCSVQLGSGSSGRGCRICCGSSGSGRTQCDLLGLGVRPAERFNVGHPSAKILSRFRCWITRSCRI